MRGAQCFLLGFEHSITSVFAFGCKQLSEDSGHPMSFSQGFNLNTIYRELCHNVLQSEMLNCQLGASTGAPA